MICHQRRRTFCLKSILYIALTWLFIMIVLHFARIVYINNNGENAVIKYFDPYSNIKNALIGNENVEYVPLPINVPHWSEIHEHFHNLPGYDLPGEYGIPVIFENFTKDEEALVDAGWALHSFNQFISDKISYHRHLPDVRPQGCKNEQYSRILPRTSVIVCFHNEAWSTLMRTIHSILDRTPPDLLQEIILVDDFSDLPHLKEELENAISPMVKVRLLRASKREGLIRARMMGAAIAKGPVLTFLDSHCECAHGWVEPLLHRIHEKPNAVVAPIIDIIDDHSFAFYYRQSDDFGVGGFNWDLQFDWHPIPEEERARRKHPWDPVRTPTMAGGLFSISKEYFEKLGKYDEGFDIWGGENLELSFKTWMCGGTLEIVPCAHVGHVFRSRSPYAWKPGGNVFRTNSIRLAEVWMDDYKHLYYKRIGTDAYNIVQKKAYGDVSSRKELRERLQCKSFDWYLKNVFPEMYVPGDTVAEGEIRNLGVGADTCLDNEAKHDNIGKPVGLFYCHLVGGNQYFLYTRYGELRRDGACVDFNGEEVVLYLCHGAFGNQMWYYDPDTHIIKHLITEKCLEMDEEKEKLTLEFCSGNPRQMWGMQNYDASKLLI